MLWQLNFHIERHEIGLLFHCISQTNSRLMIKPRRKYFLRIGKWFLNLRHKMLTLHYIKTTNFLFIKKGRGLQMAIRKNNEEKLLWNPNTYQLTKKKILATLNYQKGYIPRNRLLSIKRGCCVVRTNNRTNNRLKWRQLQERSP